MLKAYFVMALTAASFGLACSSAYPVPAQRLANAQSAARSAREVGADSLPEGQLHLKLAEEQMAAANAKLKDDDGKGAEFLLVRANADAELALALAREQRAKVGSEHAILQMKAQLGSTLDAGATR